MLSKEQISSIKKQLLEQINKSFPDDQKEQAKKQIEEMDGPQLEEFLKQNNLLQDSSRCIFCEIINQKIPSYKIAENPGSVAVLEINPVSKGHTIIIPKIHSTNHDKESEELAKVVAEALKTLKPKKIDVVPSTMFDHEILNVIPVYENESLNSKRKSESEKELQELQKIITEKISKPSNKEKPLKKEKKKEPEPITDKNTWLPKRIP